MLLRGSLEMERWEESTCWLSGWVKSAIKYRDFGHRNPLFAWQILIDTQMVEPLLLRLSHLGYE